MTGILLKVDIDSTEVDEFLKRQLSKVKNLYPFYVNVGEYLLNSLEDRFESETAPDGNRWQPLAPATVARRLKRHGNAPLTILRESGRLAGSFNYRASHDHVSVGTPVVYAALQHFGGKAGRGKKVTVPPRPVLELSAEDEARIMEIGEDFLQN